MASDDEDWVGMARRAGLHLALEQFPGDVAVAFGNAVAAMADIVPPPDLRAEPWPPMRPVPVR
ncbi:hypothetical protein [Acidisphaera sp. L21]|uniref:hypothetical protein n=1 Tax=Acidisphaera sp. L21 TaxID=1641851 RepID=UPI00131BD25A|nr:hypothetical protein [Acidisphaera sp. L21]